MRRTIVVLSAAALLVASIGLAAAQGPGGPGRRQGGMMGGRMGMMGGGLGLLRMPEVQKELNMTQPQIDKLDGAQQTMQEAMREVFQGGFQQMSPEEREKAMAKMEELQTKTVASILDQTQMKRFRQLELQRMGASALMRPSVAKELGLTSEQKSKMQEVQAQQREQMRDLFQGGFQQMSPEERQQAMQKIRENQEKANAAMLNVLTPQQKTKWAEMTGKPFKFPEFGAGMGRRGGNRPGGGPGGPGGQPPL
jgi:Spy/CpxP family protein refolding chaperone